MTKIGFVIGTELIGGGFCDGRIGCPKSTRQVRPVDFRGKIVTLLVRSELVTPSEMPFADVPRSIPGRFHTLRNGYDVQRQGHGGLRVDDPFEGTPVTGDVGGDSNACLVLSALHGAAGRRANGSRGIKVSKAHAVLGQLIDVGRIDKIVSVTADVSPTQVIDEDEHDIGLGCI